MGDLRLFGFVSFACVSMLIFQAWQRDYVIAPQEAAVAESQTLKAGSVAKSDEPDLSGLTAKENVSQTIGQLGGDLAAVSANTGSAARFAEIENDVLRLKVDLLGGSIVRSELLNYATSLEDETPITLLNETARHFFVAKKNIIFDLQTGPISSEIFTYQIASQNKNTLNLFWESKQAPGIRLEKQIRFNEDTYQVKVTDKVINNSKQLYPIKTQRELQRVYNEDDHKQGFTQTFTGGVFHNEEDKYQKFDMKELSKGELSRQSTNAWAAMIQHYFGAAWLPAATESNNYYSGGADNKEGYRYSIGFTSIVENVQVGQVYSNESTLFVGPKIEDKLEAAAEGLGLIVDFGIFTPISQPLFTALKFIHSYVGNWGWAIILLTFFIKLLFYYPSQISYKSMGKMREAQPKMQAIRDRYADDRQRQGQAMMELYKKEKINPAAGCLPMIIQIPVFISLYWALLESVELRQAPWALWIQDLSAKDPFYILPLIYGATMYVQQKLNPQPTDPIQAKIFTYLPVVFTVFFMFFPVGLVLYWITNNILTIAQQWYIYKYVLKMKK